MHIPLYLAGFFGFLISGAIFIYKAIEDGSIAHLTFGALSLIMAFSIALTI
jgi:hypothetical protein